MLNAEERATGWDEGEYELRCGYISLIPLNKICGLDGYRWSTYLTNL